MMPLLKGSYRCTADGVTTPQLYKHIDLNLGIIKSVIRMMNHLKGRVATGAPDWPTMAPSSSSLVLSSVSKTILGGIRDEEDEILPRKDYEARTQMSHCPGPS